MIAVDQDFEDLLIFEVIDTAVDGLRKAVQDPIEVLDSMQPERNIGTGSDYDKALGAFIAAHQTAGVAKVESWLSAPRVPATLLRVSSLPPTSGKLTAGAFFESP